MSGGKGDIWDIQDRAPVIGPEDQPGEINAPITDNDLAAYERAYRAMPRHLRARYDRFLCTADVIMQVMGRADGY